VIALGLLVMAAVAEAAAPPPPASPSSSRPSPPVAPAGFVAVGQPPPDDRLLDATSSRIRSELAASGLESRFVDCAGADATGCATSEALATISLLRDGDQIAIRVRALRPDGLELSRLVRVRPGEGADDPAVLAIRAVELLRDVRLDIERPPPSPPRPARGDGSPARDDEEPEPLTFSPPPEPGPPVWWLSGGPALLASAASGAPGLGPAVGLALEGDVGIAPHLAATATLAGPFNRTLGPYPAGEAALLQAVGLLGLRYRFGARAIQPFVAAFLGVEYLSARITQSGGGSGTASTWVPLAGAGLGGRVDFLRRFTASLEGDLFATEPQVSVVVAARDLGRAGAPSFLIAATVGVGFP
jgi:hypothetical protein